MSRTDVAGGTARTIGPFAIGLGGVALLSSWTGWGGIGVGLAAVACAVTTARLGRAAAPRQRVAVVAGLLGLVAIAIGAAVLAGALGDDAFGSGLSLDQCMQQADTAKLQHLCKAQHLDEFMHRYPHSDE